MNGDRPNCPRCGDVVNIRVSYSYQMVVIDCDNCDYEWTDEA